jgi:hypothetical protein
MGQALFPHPQWRRIDQMWEEMYPPAGLEPGAGRMLAQVVRCMPAFVALLVRHRPPSLRGHSLADALGVAARQPATLSALYRAWSAAPQQMYEAAPSLVFAVLGQARSDGHVSPEEENTVLAKLLTHWALRTTLDTSYLCADALRRGWPVAANAAGRVPNIA